MLPVHDAPVVLSSDRDTNIGEVRLVVLVVVAWGSNSRRPGGMTVGPGLGTRGLGPPTTTTTTTEGTAPARRGYTGRWVSAGRRWDGLPPGLTEAWATDKSAHDSPQTTSRLGEWGWKWGRWLESEALTSWLAKTSLLAHVSPSLDSPTVPYRRPTQVIIWLVQPHHLVDLTTCVVILTNVNRGSKMTMKTSPFLSVEDKINHK